MSALARKCRRLLLTRDPAKSARTEDVGTYAQVPTVCHLLRQPSPRHLGEHPQDVLLDAPDVGLNLLQRARRSVAIEIAVEIDLVADDPDLAIFFIALRSINPRVRDVRPDLAIEEGLDALGERHALGVPKLGVGLRIAVLVAADRGGLVMV